VHGVLLESRIYSTRHECRGISSHESVIMVGECLGYVLMFPSGVTFHVDCSAGSQGGSKREVLQN